MTLALVILTTMVAPSMVKTKVEMVVLTFVLALIYYLSIY